MGKSKQPVTYIYLTITLRLDTEAIIIRDPMQIIYDAVREKKYDIAHKSRLPIDPQLKHISLSRNFYRVLLKFLSGNYPHIAHDLVNNKLYGVPVSVNTSLKNCFELTVN